MSLLWAWMEELSDPGRATLSAQESRHVASRRLRVGDPLVVFDGRGRRAEACIDDLSRRAVRVEVGDIETVSACDSGFGLATAIPKGERLSTMLQMWAQIGLEVWQPLICEDSAVRSIDVEAPRLRRILIEGCKVARRPWALKVLPATNLADAIEHRDTSHPLYYGDRQGIRPKLTASTGTVFIGPEAGFSQNEASRLDAVGATPVSFSTYNMRIETAAVAAALAFNLVNR